MYKNRIILRILIIGAMFSGVTLLLWAIVNPLLNRSESAELVTQARAILSPSVEEMADPDAVDCDGAAQLLRRALDLAPSNGEARRELPLAEGCSALLRGDLILAEGALRSASRRLPIDPRPLRWLGTLALVQDRLEDARRRFARGLELSEQDVPCRVGLSDTLAELALPDEALEVLEAMEGSPLGLIETRRGILLEQLNRFDEARSAYLNAIELSPNMAEPRNNLAALERDSGNLAEALRLQHEAIELSPDDPVLLLNAGLLAIAMGRDEHAIQSLRRASELENNSADPARALADHLLVLGRVDEALEVLGSAVTRYPRDAALLNSLGNTLAAAGRIAEAQRAYQSAIVMAPDLAEPHNGLAALMLATDDLAGAETALGEALRLAPDNVQVRRNVAELEQRRRELEYAERARSLAQIHPWPLENI